MLLVLLLIALLSALALSVSLNVRSANNLQANHIDQIRARQLVNSGLVLAKLEILSVDPIQPTARLNFKMKTGSVEIQFFDEGEKIGLNSASKELFTTLLELIVSQEQAEFMSSAIIDFRDVNDIAINGKPEGEAYDGNLDGLTMKNRPFEMPSELCQFLSNRICAELSPHLTVWNVQSGFDLSKSNQDISESFEVNVNRINTALAPFQISTGGKNYTVRIDAVTEGGSKLQTLSYLVSG